MPHRSHFVSAPFAADHSVRTAVCAQRAVGSVAVAACSFALPEVGADNTVEIQVTPAGQFAPRDGRPMPAAGWRIDAAIATALIARFRALATPPVLDYEHQTLLTEANGQPAPAAGFFLDLVWREGQGLFGLAKLTSRAAQFIRDGEYRYFSPVFSYDQRTGAVLALQMGALTNNPALDGMQPLALRAAARFGLDLNNQETTVDLADQIRKLLGLPDDAADDAIIAAIKAALQPQPEVAALRVELGLPADADTATAMAAFRGRLNSTTPDPAQFVPVALLAEARTQVAALTAQSQQRELADLIEPAIADGRLHGDGLIAWARSHGAGNIASLKAFLSTATPIAAFAGSQTGGRAPVTDTNAPLSGEELAVCKATGVDPINFAKARAA